MEIPDYQDVMLPLLTALSDGDPHTIRDIRSQMVEQFQLTDEQRDQRLPSGQQTVIGNRVAWAKTYLKKAGLVDQPGRGLIRITNEGKLALVKKPKRIDTEFLKQYANFNSFYQRGKPESVELETSVIQHGTPEEVLEAAYLQTRQALADELLERIMGCTPRFFEELVVNLLVAMGYGGSVPEAGLAVGRSGDGGIDGIIKEDKLGLDVICVQAKRWEGSVGRPVIQGFVGSMEGFRARKGVLITTSTFSKEAREYVTRIERKIVLIDGQELTRLMIDYGVGVSVMKTYQINRVDLDYFVEDEV